MMTSEARYQNGQLDEVVAKDILFHLEQMDDDNWWIGITHKDGTTDHIVLSRRGNKIVGVFHADQ